MAYVHEIKFFLKNDELCVALFDNLPAFYDEFWINNISAKELGITKLPSNLELERKYSVKSLGIKPFPASKPLFEFLDVMSEKLWQIGEKAAIEAIKNL